MTGQIILIEGTDGTGKTTLTRQLAEQAGHRTAVFHAGPPENKAYINEYILPLVIARDGWTCICDRWHLGEPVWSEVFGRKPILTYEQLHIVEKQLEQFDVPIGTIYLERDEGEIRKELDSRDDQQLTAQAIEAINTYQKGMRYSKFYWDRMTLPDALSRMRSYDGA